MRVMPATSSSSTLVRTTLSPSRKRLVQKPTSRVSTLAIFAALAAIGCSGGDSAAPVPTPVLTALTVSLTPTTIQVGQTATATATGRDQFGATIAAGAITWSSSASQIATINASGSVQGVAPGQATLVASAGAVTGSAPITITAGDPLAACRLPARFGGVGLGLPRNADRQKAIGDVRVAVIFVDFPDAVATRTPQSVFAILSPTAENYFRAVSYGRMNLILEPSFVWRRMSGATTQYGWSALSHINHRIYIQEAVDLAASVNFANSDAITVISNPDAGALNNGPTFIGSPSSGITADGKLFMNATTSGRDLLGWGGFWLNHEMGHSMGLADLYAYSGAGHRFVGGFSLMGLIGGFAREFFAWERWVLGWVDDTQVSCASAGTSDVVLSPIERSGGVKMVVVPTGTTSALVVESRRAEGFDTNGAFSPGAVVYFIDTAVASGNGVLRVLPINDADGNKGSAPLQPGQSISSGGVTITFLSQDAGGDRVRVVR
jgi:M6 family metalloprotease-like protein